MLRAERRIGALPSAVSYPSGVETVREAGVPAQAWQARVAAALIALALLAAAPAGASGEVFKVAQDAADVRAYWTAERMREAIPARTLSSQATTAKRGGTIATRVRHPLRGRKRAHGKVFFRLDGVNYVCSGTNVIAPAENVVWTAAHCMYGSPGASEGYATHWEFVPGYRNGDAPFGEWVATDLAVTPEYRNSCLPFLDCDDLAHDFGAANVSKPGGKTLEDRVRGRRLEFNGPRDLTYKAFGYPAESPFNGQRLYKCKSPWQGNDNNAGNPPPIRIRCDMTGGSSGGGWVADGTARAITSYGYNTQPDNLYGPYQSNSAQQLYNLVKNG